MVLLETDERVMIYLELWGFEDCMKYSANFEYLLGYYLTYTLKIHRIKVTFSYRDQSINIQTRTRPISTIYSNSQAHWFRREMRSIRAIGQEERTGHVTAIYAVRKERFQIKIELPCVFAHSLVPFFATTFHPSLD
jgi:hypothetical protein